MTVIWPADSAEIRRKKSAGVQKMGMVCGFLHCSSTQKSADQRMSEFHWALVLVVVLTVAGLLQQLGLVVVYLN